MAGLELVVVALVAETWDSIAERAAAMEDRASTLELELELSLALEDELVDVNVASAKLEKRDERSAAIDCDMMAEASRLDDDDDEVVVLSGESVVKVLVDTEVVRLLVVTSLVVVVAAAKSVVIPSAKPPIARDVKKLEVVGPSLVLLDGRLGENELVKSSRLLVKSSRLREDRDGGGGGGGSSCPSENDLDAVVVVF